MTYPCLHRERRRATFRASLFFLPLLLILFASPAAAKVHKVRRGDSLARIAKKYRVSVEELRAANSLASDDLGVGDRLVVPPRGAKGGKGAARAAKGKATAGKDVAEAGGDSPSRGEEAGVEGAPPAPPGAASSRPVAAEREKDESASPVSGKGGDGRVDPASAAGKEGGRAARKHKVRRGDSLARIAKKYRVSVEDLRAANSLASDDLAVGTRLLVPAGPAGKGSAPARERAAAPTGSDAGEGAPGAASARDKASAAAPAAAAGGKAVRKHKVRRGDSLARIAKKYRVSVEDLRAANSLASDDLTVGTRLVVPTGPVAKGDTPSREKDPPSRTAEGGRGDSTAAPDPPVERHKVKKGDTLASVAKEHHLSVKELRRLNRMGRKGRLRPGSSIVVSRSEGKGRRGPDPATVDRKMRTVAAIPVVPGSEGGALPLREGGAKGGERCANPPGGVGISASPPSAEEGDERILLAAEGDGSEQGWDITGKILSLAKSMLDVPYRFGGSSFRGIDCSGYVQKVFSYLDIPLPRSAREQFQRGERIEREQLSKGDLVFFQTYARFPSHVGIYLGDNQFIHASSRDRKVRIDSLDTPYYVKRYIGARRMQGLLGGDAAELQSAAEPIPGTIPEKKGDAGMDGP
jgi:LysM repeat protein